VPSPPDTDAISKSVISLAIFLNTIRSVMTFLQKFVPAKSAVAKDNLTPPGFSIVDL
jgi:hypothetical protein